MNQVLTAAAAVLCLSLGACANGGLNHSEIGAIGGAVAGGLAGSALTHGSTAGTVIGAGAGAVAGHEIGKRVQ